MVRLENVGLRYGHGPEILKDVNFRMDVGEFAFLTGPSGAGKSSLLRLLFLAQRPSRGAIRLFGEDVAKLNRKSLPAAPPPHRRGLPGVPPARPPDDL